MSVWDWLALAAQIWLGLSALFFGVFIWLGVVNYLRGRRWQRRIARRPYPLPHRWSTR